MKAEEARRLLEPYNPWWFQPDWSQQNPLLNAVRESVLKTLPRLFYHVTRYLPKPGYYGVVTIRGPRRVGKTTLIMSVIEHLTQRVGVKPESVFYIPLDYEKLRHISLFDLISAIAELPGEKYIFLDEASMHRDWALHLKNLVDANRVQEGKLKIVVTGSHSMDLADAVSKLSDRQGPLASLFNLGGNLIHMPLRFVEVLEAIEPGIDQYLASYNLRKPSQRFDILRQLSSGSIPEILGDFYSRFAVLLDTTFEAYLLHGGFPKAVNLYYKKGRIDPEFYHDLAKLIISDSASAGLKPENTKRVVEYLTEPYRLSSLMGLEKRENIGNLVTGVDEDGFPSAKFGLGRYLEYLETTKIFLFPYREDPSEKCAPNYKADRKVYILDPFSYHALRGYVQGDNDPFSSSKRMLDDQSFKGRLIESVVAAHLVMAQQLFEHVALVDYHKVLLYTRGDSETDHVLCLTRKGEKHRFLIESKFRKGTPRIANPATIVLTKDTLRIKDIAPGSQEKVVYIPVTLFLVLL